MELKKITLVFILAFLINTINAQENILSNSLTSINGFIENKGQILDQNEQVNTDVEFLFNAASFKIQLKKNSFGYDTYTREKIENSIDKASSDVEVQDQYKYYFHRVDIEFVNANPNPTIEVFEPMKGHLNYFPKNASGSGIQNIKAYKRVVYKNLYPFIDLEFVVDDNCPKYNFILHKGADINCIQWSYLGAKSTNIEDGKIQIKLSNGILKEEIPSSFYVGNRHDKVSICYKRRMKNVYGFEPLNQLSKEFTLIIDPVPEVMWATYLGGQLKGEIFDLAIDSKDNIYAAGSTQSVANITTTGAYQDTLTRAANGFFIKLSSQGQPLYGTVYSTFGKIEDINCDNYDNVIVSGRAYDDSSGTSGVFQPVRLNIFAGHVAKFDSSGNRLWATYISSSVDYHFTIRSTVDNSNAVLVCGETLATDTTFTTTGAYQQNLPFTNFNKHSYLLKLDTTGNLSWGTYVASEDELKIKEITTDKWSNIIIAGYTEGMQLISTPGTFYTSPWQSIELAFVMKFNTSGQKTWGTYYGGQSFNAQIYNCYPKGLTSDNAGSIYMIGETKLKYSNSLDSLGTLGAHQTMHGGSDYDAYIVKFNSNGTRAWASYYGGAQIDKGTSVITNANNEVYLIGIATSSNNISSQNSLQTALNGNGDSFIAKFTSSGQRVYGSYFGGSGGEVATDIEINSYGKLILSVNTTSSNYLTDSSSFQSNSLSNGVYVTAHLSKLADCTLPIIQTLSTSDTIVCPGEQITITLSGQLNDANNWGLFQNDTLIQSTPGNTFSVIVNDSSSFYVKGTGGCVVKSDASKLKIHFDTVPIVNAGVDTSVCEGNSFQLLASGTAVNYTWSNGIANGTSFVPTQSKELILTGTSSSLCVKKDTFQLAVIPLPQGVSYSNGFSVMCLNHPPRPLYGGLPAGGYYTGPGVDNGLFYPDSVGQGNHQVIYVYTNTYGCSVSAIDHILVDPCVGFYEVNTNVSFNIYPIPAKDRLNIEFYNSNNKHEIFIYNAFGQQIENFIIKNNLHILDLSKYAKGVYYYRIHNKEDQREVMDGAFMVIM